MPGPGSTKNWAAASNSETVLTASSHQIALGGMVTWGSSDAPPVFEARIWNAETGEPLTPPLPCLPPFFRSQRLPKVRPIFCGQLPGTAKR